MNDTGQKNKARNTAVGDLQQQLVKQITDDRMEEFFSTLSRALKSRSVKVRDAAILLVTEQKITEAGALIEPLLGDKSKRIRYNAAECLGILYEDSGRQLTGLRNLLQDPSDIVRAQALESLALLKDRRALPEIVPLLSDDDPVVRSYAAASVGVLGGVSYKKALRRNLKTDKEELARVGFYEGLFLLGEREALKEMLMLLQSQNYRVRCAVANTVESMPLSQGEVREAITYLASAGRKPLTVADKTTITRVLTELELKEKQ